MKKRLISILLVIMMLMGMIPVSVFNVGAETEDEFIYVMDFEGITLPKVGNTPISQLYPAAKVIILLR